MYAMLISVEKGIENVRVKKGKPKLGPKIAIFVKCFLTSDFITAWCWRMFIVPFKNRCFFLKKNRNISLLRFFGPVFTPKASKKNVGKDILIFNQKIKT